MILSQPGMRLGRNTADVSFDEFSHARRASRTTWLFLAIAGEKLRVSRRSERSSHRLSNFDQLAAVFVVAAIENDQRVRTISLITFNPRVN